MTMRIFATYAVKMLFIFRQTSCCYQMQKCITVRSKKIPVFRVTLITRPYQNVLAKPRTFQFFCKIIIECTLKGETPFKCIFFLFFPEKKCVPTLPRIIKPVTQTHTSFFYLASYIVYAILLKSSVIYYLLDFGC